MQAQVGIVLAAARGVVGRGRWAGTGIAAGLLGAGLVAASADGIASAQPGVGQEVFNASVLFIAVAMLGWHNVWMKRHGRAGCLLAGPGGSRSLPGERGLEHLLDPVRAEDTKSTKKS